MKAVNRQRSTMFTGIVKGLGTVIAIEAREAFKVFKIEVGDLVPNPQIGGSVAINGVCLTIAQVDGSILAFEVMAETLKRSTFNLMSVGEKVGIETPLRLGDELGGHIVQGHVDGTAQLLEREQVGENVRLRFWISGKLGRQILPKGSVALDGVSLTVCDPVAYPNAVETKTKAQTFTFDVWLVPLTLVRTTLGHKIVGEKVNVEIDYWVKIISNLNH